MDTNLSNYENEFNNFELRIVPATKLHSRGRASGGCIFGFRKRLEGITCEFKQIGAVIHLDLKINGKRFRIIPTYVNCNHWDTDFENIKECLTCGGTENVLVVGDLNARIGNERGSENKRIGRERQSKDTTKNARGTKLLELCNSFGLRVMNGTIDGDYLGEFTFIGKQGSSVIDYGLEGGDWSSLIKNFEVEKKPFSDHLPVVVSFTNGEEEDQVLRDLQLLPKLRWINDSAPIYRRQLDTLLMNEDSDTSLNKIEQCIKGAYHQSINSRRVKTTFRERWFDKECMRARSLSYTWLNAYRRFNTLFTKDLYIEYNQKFKTLCRRKKKDYFEDQAKKLAMCNNSSEFWNLARKLNGTKYVIGRELDPSMLKLHFQQLLNPATPNQFPTHYAHPGFENNILDQPISCDEVCASINEQKDGKAAGSDGIPAEFYRYGTGELVANLTEIFNYIFEHGTIPEQFKEALIFPIYKKGSTEDPTNYRGISFLNASYKIFTSILNKRLNKWIDFNNLLSEYQAGFRSGYSTIDHIFVLRTIADSFISRNKKLFAFFVDFKSAFDTVDRNALFYKLCQKGMSLKFGRVLQNLYMDTKAAVWNGKNLSDWFSTNSGVRQGCALSPSLFALFIEDIVEILAGGIEYADMTIKALLFADDIVLLAYTPQSLQLMINRLSVYCSRWNLEVNLNKSKVMIFKKGGGRIGANEHWHYNNETIEVVQEYKYLGVYFTKNLSMEKHFTEKLTKAKTAINVAWKQCFNNSEIAHSSKFRVFEAVSESVLFYAAQVWGGRKYDQVEKLLRFYIKRIFRLPPNTANYMIMLETGVSPLFIKTFKLQVDYVMKVLNMPNHRLPKKVVLQAIQTRTGWFKDWVELAEQVDFEINYSDPVLWKPALYTLIARLDDAARDRHKEQASSSLHRMLYSRLDYNLNERNYFRDDYTIEQISLMFRLRGELLNLNFMPHREDLPLLCSLCNMGEREDVLHFVGRCGVLKETRRYTFGSDYLSDEEIFGLLHEMDVTKLSMYCKTALRYRKQILNEAF